MNNKQSNKESARRTVRKVLSLTHKLIPGYITFLLIVKMMAAAQPFIQIYFSSLILDGLLRLDSFDSIFRNVLIMIGLDSLLVLIRWRLEGINWVKKHELTQKINKMLTDKTMEFDFDILEKHETLDTLKKAKDGITTTGDIRSFCDNLAGIIEKLTTIVYSVVLLIPLFIPKVLEETAGLSSLCVFLNQWYSIFIMILVLAIHVFVSYETNKKSSLLQMQFFEKNVSYNRYFSYWFDLIFNYSIGKYIRLYKMQKLMIKKVQETNDNLEKEGVAWINKDIKISFIPFLSQAFMQFVSYSYVGLKAVFSLISAGKCLMYVSSYTRLVESITGISNNFVQIKMESRYLAFFYDYMEIKNKRYDGTIPTEKRDDNKFEIEFRNVSFRYANTEKYALRHVNQKITLGSKNAVVGKNGAGKTTFIKLLCRLYEPTEGQILLNGVDIRYYDYEEYAKLFAVVFQDFNLFSFPLGENVASGIEYNRERAIKCLEQAGFKERFEKLEKGLDTPLYQYEDENGVEISGGEAQKIAIARTLYKDAPFVIMDEPTSALDPVAEYEIYQSFDKMVEGKTSIYISHRMSSCRFCDNILVFDEGQIVEQGSHDKLMSNGGLYSELWNAQAQYYA
ncbi:ATP-binding cassette, subfamily B [Treponema bryantii]|uniref:ATP-binding cassette, subfamily B n=1 Tax=Treponema bryantii TaxID=163 RepID=A0A1H9AMG2_9SPIR|nr:ABC transporter ATP-binding protein [Treponema bryantii]SEP77745.1 ATP-binding cassette, subfamily B [Treponema bryantii]